MGYVSSQSEAYVSLGTVTPCSPSSLVQSYGHHDNDCPCHHSPYGDSSCSISARHHSLSLHHSCILLFYDHTITIFYDSHDPHVFLSFSYTARSESRPTFIWLFISLTPLLPSDSAQPTLFVIILFLFIMWYLRSYFCHDHSSIYGVVAVRCSPLAL